jgi:hypothetical protein
MFLRWAGRRRKRASFAPACTSSSPCRALSPSSPLPLFCYSSLSFSFSLSSSFSSPFRVLQLGGGRGRGSGRDALWLRGRGVLSMCHLRGRGVLSLYHARCRRQGTHVVASRPSTEHSRGITVLVLMTRCYGTMPTTFALSVSLFDRFLEARASGEVQLDCFAGVATAGSSAPVERIQQLCAPLSCLMMAIKFLEVRAPALSDVVLMANRLCLESQARSPPGSPRGTEGDEGFFGPYGGENQHQRYSRRSSGSWMY